MEKLDVYKCGVCGNIIEVLHVGGGPLACCGQPMSQLKENTQDAATEKHVPVVNETKTGVEVVIGEVEHPMGGDHFIEWIEVITTNNGVLRQFLSPNAPPKAEFNINKSQIKKTREFCNLHGLWSV